MKNKLAKQLIKLNDDIILLAVKMDILKGSYCEIEEKLIELLDGTGEIIQEEGWYFTCNSPKGSVEINKDKIVPRNYCTSREVYSPDKKRIKAELQSGVELNFAKIVYNTKLIIKEVE